MSKHKQEMHIPLWLESARAAYNTRDIQRAAMHYQNVLAKDARHIESLNMLALIHAETGNNAEALKLIDKAIAAQPSFGRSHFNRGVILENARQPVEALASFDTSIALDANFTQAYLSRSNVLKMLGRLAEAAQACEQCIAVNPAISDAYFLLGNLLQHMGRPDQSLAQYDKAIALNPSFAPYYNNKGAAFKAMNKRQEACECYEKAIALFPSYDQAYSNLGLAQEELGLVDAALVNYDKALALNPNLAEPYNNKGILLGIGHHYDEALAHYDKAIALKPDYAYAYNNKGFTLQEMKRYGEALVNYDMALRLDPQLASAYSNKAMLALLLGQFEEGWKLMEWRWRRPDAVPPQFASQLWLGGVSLEGKTLLLYGEQGMGDAIQFCCYLPLLEAMGAKLILQVHAPLIPLMATLGAKMQCISFKDCVPPHDLHCPLMSLPLAMGTKIETVPATVPYLHATAEKRSLWAERAPAQGKKRVGLVWSGNAKHKNNHNRSMKLTDCEPLLALGDTYCFYILQKDITEQEKQLLAQWGIDSFEDLLTDFSDTAALVEQMDVVISVDTSVAHLAGAMGKKTWVLLPFAPDYRWLAEGETNPWYPTARLFRQSGQRSWSEVIAQVVAMLEHEQV